MATDAITKVRILQLLNLQKRLLETSTVEIKKLVVQAEKNIVGIKADRDSTENDLLTFEDELVFLQHVLDALPSEYRGAVDVNPKVSYVTIAYVPPEMLVDAFRSVLITRLFP